MNAVQNSHLVGTLSNKTLSQDHVCKHKLYPGLPPGLFSVILLPVESRLKKKQGSDTNSSQLKFGNQSAQAAKRNQQNNFIQAPKAFPLISHKCQLFQRPVLEILGVFLTDLYITCLLFL